MSTIANELTALMPIRIGHGYDVHRTSPERPLHLGGVLISEGPGLLGHSDADVILHALMDALLGAFGLPDIGHYFPPSDEQWRGADSSKLLTRVVDEILPKYQVINVDLTLIAERPKISPYVDEIKAKIASLLRTDSGRVGFKATTQERVGALGRGEGMCAYAVVLLQI